MAGSSIYHVAIEDDWGMSRKLGWYEASTRGHSLFDDGYIRACSAEHVQTVLDDVFADLALPLVVVELDADALESAGVPVERRGDAEADIRVLDAIPSNDPAIVVGLLRPTREAGRWLAPAELAG